MEGWREGGVLGRGACIVTAVNAKASASASPDVFCFFFCSGSAMAACWLRADLKEPTSVRLRVARAA